MFDAEKPPLVGDGLSKIISSAGRFGVLENSPPRENNKKNLKAPARAGTGGAA
jgi:hypothetical protein